MRNLIACFSLLVSSFYVEEDVCVVNRLEYKPTETYNDILKINIEIYSSNRDIVTLKAVLSNDVYYTSSIEVYKTQKTIAKIPINTKTEDKINLIIDSHNKGTEIINLSLPLYQYEKQVCDFTYENICESEYPSIIKYENNRVIEIYEKIGLINQNLHFYSYDNMLPINKVSLVNSVEYEEKEGYAYLLFKEKEIPLNIENNNKIISFSLTNKYYLDIKEGKVYDEYQKDTIYDDKLVFPYVDKTYDFTLFIMDYFISFSEIIIPFKVITFNSFVGACNSSVYCIKKVFVWDGFLLSLHAFFRFT